MSYESLINYLENYLKNDMTRSALLLSGKWGIGKSYFLEHDVKDAFEQNNIDLIFVSLYGVTSIAELNKSIYYELRVRNTINKVRRKLQRKLQRKKNNGNNGKLCQWIKKHHREIGKASFLLGKTIVKGVAGFFSVPLKVSNTDINRLYKSINLQGKLIVLEDLERSGVDILELLGYVNSLVEQDGIKVLLVANEEEIIKNLSSHSLNANKTKKKSGVENAEDSDFKKYLREKEKTISDTILFKCNVKDAVAHILTMFDSKIFSELLKQSFENISNDIVNQVVGIMTMLDNYNLRAFIFACQKIVDMLRIISDNKNDLKIDADFFESTFLSVVAFSLRLKSDSALVWEDDVISPNALGINHYLLSKHCYNYIKNQTFDVEEFLKYQDVFVVNKEIAKKGDKFSVDFNVLKNFYFTTEAKLVQAVRNIANYIDDILVIPISMYGQMANYLIAIRSLIDEEQLIDDCMSKMLFTAENNVISEDDIISIKNHYDITLEKGRQQDDYVNFINNLVTMYESRRDDVYKNASTNEDWETIILNLRTNADKFINDGAFARKISIKGLVNYLSRCEAEQILNLRQGIDYLYRASNIGDFLSGDKPNLNLLKEGIETLLEKEQYFDRISKFQLTWLAKDLKRIINKL